MVLRQSVRRPIRPTAILLCLLMVAPTFALLATPTTTGQLNQLSWDLKLVQGEAGIFQKKDATSQAYERVYFLANNSTARIQLHVYNHGSAEVTNFPVYFWFNDTPLQTGGSLNPGFKHIKGGCVKVSSVAGATVVDGVVKPGVSPPVIWDFPVPVNAPAVGFNVTIRVNSKPDPAVEDLRNAECTASITGTDGSGKQPTVGDWEDHTVDHAQTARVYFVKDRKLDLQVDSTATSPGIRWCVGEPTSRVCNERMSIPDDPLYNRTVHPKTYDANGNYVDNEDQQPTFFQVNVKNTGNWHNVSNYGGPCSCDGDGFPYEVKVVARGYGLNATTENVTWTAAKPAGTGWQTVGRFSLRNMSGVYAVNVTLDPLRKLVEMDDNNNWANRTVEVAWLDFVADVNASNFKTTLGDAYEYDTSIPIRGWVNFGNVGTAPLIHPEGQTPRVTYRIHMPGTNFSETYTETLADGFANRTNKSRFIHIDWDANNVLNHVSYIRPGKHVIVAEIDPGNEGLELNETNNRRELEIYVQDKTAPKITFGPFVQDPDTGVNVQKVRPADLFEVRARVEDDDVANANVRVNFTLNSNSSVNRSYALRLEPGTTNDFQTAVGNFKFHGNGTTEDWSYQLEVSDSFGNKVASAKSKLTLERWPIQTVPLTDVMPSQHPDNATFPYGTKDPVIYVIKVLKDWTGVDDQPNVTANLFINVTPAGGREHNLSDKGWTVLTSCTNVTTRGTTDELLEQAAPRCNTADGMFSHFSHLVSEQMGEPGQWNLSIGIMDAAGDVRRFNRTFRYLDNPPVIVSTGVLNGNTTNLTHANVNDSIRITANLTDDRLVDSSKPSITAYANFSRHDGKWLNRTLTPRKIIPVEDANGTSVNHAIYDEVVTVGQGKELGFADKMNVTVSVVDNTGNWVVAPSVEFIVNDTRPPVLLDPKATPNVQEVGQDVTFSARGVDETNVHMRLTVFSGSTPVLGPLTLRPEGKEAQNFTHVANFTTEGNYRWEMALFDAQGRDAFASGTLSIRDNLGPRFEIRAPGILIDGTRYGTATPRIEVVAFDGDTVDATSIQLTVDGQPVVPELGPPPAGMTGLTVGYQVPAARKFLHGEEVAVNVTAMDGSSKRLQGWSNFTFKVDDVAPTARLASFEPRHRDAASHVWNVSLATRFVLGAEDADDMPTGVSAIRYRILGGGANSAESLYTQPFRISDAPGVYRGPLVYQIQYWAEDEVGNVNRTPSIASVFVDDAPPQLIQYFPQGRYVNATFVDDRVGVSRAVVWHRVNSQPYQALTLTPDAGNLWRGVIPDATKGDRVSYYLQSWDHLNNTETFGNASDPRVEFSATNREPSVRITSPVAGSRVSGNFPLQWNASDEDGDALVFTIAYKGPGRPSYSEMAKLETSESRSYPIDSRRFQDGEYVFRVSANDGGVVKHSEVAVSIINRADAIVSVPPVDGEVVVGGTVLIKAEIAKAGAEVEARLYRNGELVLSYPLNDQGRNGDEVANDGVYSARVPVEDSGDYTVEIFTQYQEDGELKTSSMKNAASFSAKLTPGYVLREYAVVLALIALAAVVAIGVAAWAVLRRRG